MKYMKKLMALLAALTLALAMAVPALAEQATYTITIKNGTGTYAAYQIFKGDLHNDTLSNIQWGDGVTADVQTALGDAAEKAKSLENNETAAKAFAVEVAQYLADNPAHTGTDSITVQQAGYYLIKNTEVPGNEVFTDYILEVVKDVTVSPKSGKPTLNKEIKHNETNTWGVVGDNQIGDTVEFRTITTVPNVSGYTQYKYVIHDEMSAGLTSNVTAAAGVTIKVNDTTVLDTAYYTVAVDETNTNKFTVTIDVLNAIQGGIMSTNDTLYTYYTGILNENAKVYDEDKQNNTAYLEYSNNPHGDTTTTTPEKFVYDWTFKMNVSKVDGADTSTQLDGAKFVLSEKNSLNLGTIGEDGTPATTDNLIKLIDNGGGSYTVAPTNHTGSTVYVMTAGNITIKGLDDATDYYLYETKAPAGYNRLTKAVKFKITADYDTTGNSYTSVSTQVANTDPQQSVSITVKNNKGATLPSTGGIGTTLFYVIGGGLMAVAAVLLVTKKRMNNK